MTLKDTPGDGRAHTPDVTPDPALPQDPATRERLKDILEAKAHAVAWRCDRPDCDGLPHEGREYRHARGKQQPPWGQFVTLPNGNVEPVTFWYLRGGRGSGKTWAGACALAEIILWYGGTDENGNARRYAVVGPDFGYAKDTLIEGESGLLVALGADQSGGLGPFIAKYNLATATITMKSGAIIRAGGIENGAKVAEGKNLSAVWCDEVGLWHLKKWQYAYTQAVEFALRIDPAIAIFTGTPKEGHPLVKALIADPRVASDQVMATAENHALPERVRKRYEDKWGNTRLGRQELYGENLEDKPGALWTSAGIETYRWQTPPEVDEMERIVIGWDPAVTSGDDSDEHGIVVCARVAGDPTEFVVLDDRSGRYTTAGACRVVADVFEQWNADRVVVEVNNGGDWIPELLRTVAPTVPVATVRASRGKRLRAEPVAALSEQGRLHLVGDFGTLEDQMTGWTPEEPGSPDRLDALVWGITELMGTAGKTRRYRAGRGRGGRN